MPSQPVTVAFPGVLDMTTTTFPSTPSVAESGLSFVDRRGTVPASDVPARERRQFTNSYSELSDEAAELANAIDAYKARHRRRFIDYEEVLGVVKSLGYTR